MEHVFPLAQIADAHILIEAHKVRGKIVINNGD
nr:zinc-binding dehydrogenase [Paenibacillus sp. Leaf72]